MDNAKREKDKSYYLEGIKILLKPDETIEGIPTIYKEYNEAYKSRKAIIDNLFNEIKIIKKLKV